MNLSNDGPNGPKIDGYYCSKIPWGCIRGQCMMCSFYIKPKPEGKITRFIRWILGAN